MILMKIAIVSDRIYPFYIGGYEYYLHKIGSRLSETHDLTIMTSFASPPVIQECDRVNYVRFSRFRDFTNSKGEHSVLGIFKFLLSSIKNIRILKDYDLVILNSIPYIGVTYMIRRIRKESKVAVIFYEAWYNYPKGHLISYFKRYLLREKIKKIVDNTNYLLSISQSTTDSLVNNYGAKNVVTTPLGIDTDSIRDSVPSSEKFDLVYLGRLAAIKHVEDLLKALENLKMGGYNIKAAIIGDGPQRKVLEDIVEKRKLKQNVKFFGKIPDVSKFSILKSSRIFVMPSEREGFSISTLEAMACGCVPVVAKPEFPELFGTSHFVKNEVNGIYFPVNDAETLAARIVTLISDNDYYSRLQIKALQDSTNYSWDNTLGIIEEYIENLFL